MASTGILTKLNAVGDALKTSLYLDDSLNLLNLATQLENLTANNIIGKTIPTSMVNGDVTADPATVQTFVMNLIANNNNAAKPTPSSSTSKSKIAPLTPAASTSTAPIDSKCIY